MSQFFQDLWESIFTPGPTPTLLLATNVTFAALQIVLFALLLATYSIHFIILSFISGGLWWAINWFARELQASHNDMRDLKARKTGRAAHQASLLSSSEEGESETEVETFLTKTKTRAQQAAGASGGVEVRGPAEGELKQRGPASSSPPSSSPPQDRTSSVSTEDEWEKVSEYESEKAQ